MYLVMESLCRWALRGEIFIEHTALPGLAEAAEHCSLPIIVPCLQSPSSSEPGIIFAPVDSASHCPSLTSCSSSALV